MKFSFEIQPVQIKVGETEEVIIQGLKIEGEYTLEEVQGLYTLQKEMINDMPELTSKIAKAFKLAKDEVEKA